MIELPGVARTAQHHNLAEAEVFGYTRKSVEGEGRRRRLSRSQEGQGLNIQATSERLGVPFTAANVLHEERNHGGDEWWEGGGVSGIQGDHAEGEATRPIFTVLVRFIVSGVCRAVGVWDIDRLARQVAIMEQLMGLMNKYGCLLFDRNGWVDIQTAAGRNQVIHNMAGAQYYRERCKEDAPRGIKQVRDEGGLVTPACRVGFRSAGPHTGEVVPVHEELEIVNLIFRLYVLGDDEHGPYSVPQITEYLNRQGVRWLEDSDKHSERRRRTGIYKIGHTTVYHILSDCAYVGRQRHKTEIGGAGDERDEFACSAFLIDGRTAVEEWLYEEAQAKRRAGSTTHSKHVSAPLTGKIACGVCGVGLRKNQTTDGCNEDGTIRYVPAWKSVGVRVGFPVQCPHHLPALRIDRMNQYLRDHLAPELLGELQRLTQASEQDQAANRRAALSRELDEAVRRLDEELPKYALHVSPEMLGKMEREARGEIAVLRGRIRELDDRLADAQRLRADMANLDCAPESVLREIADRSILWAAVIPDEGDDVNMGGRVVFCTRWGTLRTAVIRRDPKAPSARVHPHWRIEPARLDQSIGSVADFPDPDAFVEQQRHAYAVADRPFDLEVVAPGYCKTPVVPTHIIE